MKSKRWLVEGKPSRGCAGGGKFAGLLQSVMSDLAQELHDELQIWSVLES